MTEIKVLVVDDSAFFRKMIVSMLESSMVIKVVGVAVNGKEAIDKVSELMPDVITMDIEMPVMDGVTCSKKDSERSPYTYPYVIFIDKRRNTPDS